MKFTFQSLAFVLLLFGTTFCSKEQQTPAPSIDGKTGTANIAVPPTHPPYPSTPIGFNAQNCSADPAGINAPLYNEARSNAYAWDGTQLSEADFTALKATVDNNTPPVVDANGHIAGTAYDSRVNNFADGIKAQMDEYNYYVYWASLHGSDVQNVDDVKGIIQEQFDYTIPVQPGENLSQADQARVALFTAATRPQLTHALQLFSSLYQCEVNYRSSSSADTKATAQVVSFKEFLKLRKAGQIKSPAGDPVYAQGRGFWGFLKKAVHIVISVVIYTLAGAADGSKIAANACGTNPPASCTTASYIIAAAGGFINGIIKVANGNCVFGGC